MKVSPLGVLFALVIIGVTIEVVERESKPAAFALVILLLLGIVTFNAKAFTAQIANVMALLDRPSAPARSTSKAGDTGGGAGFK